MSVGENMGIRTAADDGKRQPMYSPIYTGGILE